VGCWHYIHSYISFLKYKNKNVNLSTGKCLFINRWFQSYMFLFRLENAWNVSLVLTNGPLLISIRISHLPKNTRLWRINLHPKSFASFFTAFEVYLLLPWRREEQTNYQAVPWKPSITYPFSTVWCISAKPLTAVGHTRRGDKDGTVGANISCAAYWEVQD